MNRKILLILVALIIGTFCQAQTATKQLQEFALDLTSANIKLRGELKLFGQYQGDLSSLKYNNYLELLKKNESSSGKGVVELIQGAEKHIFATKKNSFLIAIYSKRLNAVLYDDSSTAFTDSVKVLKYNEKVPDLAEFIRKSGFLIVN